MTAIDGGGLMDDNGSRGHSLDVDVPWEREGHDTNLVAIKVLIGIFWHRLVVVLRNSKALAVPGISQSARAVKVATTVYDEECVQSCIVR